MVDSKRELVERFATRNPFLLTILVTLSGVVRDKMRWRGGVGRWIIGGLWRSMMTVDEELQE
jgi:hypothetical protein